MPKVPTLKVIPYENSNGSTSWRVTGSYPISADAPKGRVRKNFKDHKEALNYKDHLMLLLEAHKGRLAMTKLTEMELQAAEAATARLALSGRTVTLSEIVEDFLKRNPPIRQVAPSKVLEEFLHHIKHDRQRKDAHVHSLRSSLLRFFDHVDTTSVHRIDSRDCKGWIMTAISPQSQKNRRSHLHNFFDWCLEESYVNENPVKTVKAYHKAGPRRKPEIFSLDQLEGLLSEAFQYLGGIMLPYYTVVTGSGLRPEEAKRLDSWDHFLLDRQDPLISAYNVSKTVDRNIPLRSGFAEILRWCRDKNLKPGYYNRSHAMEVRRRCGLDFPWDGTSSDICRHSYASYEYEFNGYDLETLSHTMGNSKNILRTRYIVPVLPEDARRFCSLSLEDISDKQPKA